MTEEPNQNKSVPMANHQKDTKMEFTDVTVAWSEMDTEGETDSTKETAKQNEEKLGILRLQVLFWIFLQRFVEMEIVIPLTLLAINWNPLTKILENAFWPLGIFILLSALAIKALERLPGLAPIPRCFIVNLPYVLFLTAFFFFLAIHFPRIHFYPNLSPYFAIVAAGICATTYISICICSITQMVNSKDCSLYLCALAVPFYALLISQVVYYFAYRNDTYAVFMLNVAGGILASLLCTIENIYLNKKHVNSKKLEEFAKTTGVISLTESRSMVSLIYRLPEDDKQDETRDVANV